MADHYTRVSARYWVDSKGWGERHRLVGLYLLTNTHSTMEGLYHLPLGYLCADLALTPKQAKGSLDYLSEVGLVVYDADAEVVFVRKALKHGAPATERHIQGAVNRLKSVPWSFLWHGFAVACECHAEGLANAIREEWPNAFESSVLSTQHSNSFLRDAVPDVDEEERAGASNNGLAA